MSKSGSSTILRLERASEGKMLLEPRGRTTKWKLEAWLDSPLGAGAIEKVQPLAERQKKYPGFSLRPYPTSTPVPPNALTNGQEKLGKAAAGVSLPQHRTEHRKGEAGSKASGLKTYPGPHLLTVRIK